MYREDKPGGGGVEQGARITRWLPHGEDASCHLRGRYCQHHFHNYVQGVFSLVPPKKLMYGKPRLDESTLT